MVKELLSDAPVTIAKVFIMAFNFALIFSTLGLRVFWWGNRQIWEVLDPLISGQGMSAESMTLLLSALNSSGVFTKSQNPPGSLGSPKTSLPGNSQT
jgi:hypothetical protein